MTIEAPIVRVAKGIPGFDIRRRGRTLFHPDALSPAMIAGRDRGNEGTRMKVVIDSNRLRSHELRDYLRRSRSNKAVLIDYALIEAYKKDADKTIGRSMAISGQYPEQVLVLRSTGTIYGLDPRKPDMTGRMVWPEHTKTFGLFVGQLDGIAEGAPSTDDHVRYLQGEARVLLARRNEEARVMPELFEHMRSQFSNSQHKAYREQRAPPDDALDGICAAAKEIAESRSEKPFNEPFVCGDMLNHFAFRHAFASVLQMWEWAYQGPPVDLPDKRRENDAADAVFATYGTYFNGLMTGDRGAMELHGRLRGLLRRLGGDQAGRARMPTPYP